METATIPVSSDSQSQTPRHWHGFDDYIARVDAAMLRVVQVRAAVDAAADLIQSGIRQ